MPSEGPLYLLRGGLPQRLRVDLHNQIRLHYMHSDHWLHYMHQGDDLMMLKRGGLWKVWLPSQTHAS